MHSAFRLPVSDVRRAQPASLAPELRTDAALRWLLLGQLDEIEDARADLSVEDDSERLHDLRVSLRRARTLVDASAGVFPEPVRTRFKRNLKGANELTGPVRDLDVLLAAFGRYRSRLPSEGRPYLELLRREVERERQPASRTVRAGLSSDGWRQWIGAWRTFLGSPVPRRSTLARAMQPVYEVATACIDRSLAKVTKHGGRIASDTPAEALHPLRLKVKRLRYLVEGFRSLYAADAIADLIGALKTFQDYLGAHQDLEVHARAIGAHAARLEADARATPAVRAAVRGLTDALSEERRTLRALYPQRLAGFDAPGQLAIFRTMAQASRLSC